MRYPVVPDEEPSPLERVLATTYAGGKAYRRRWPPPADAA